MKKEVEFILWIFKEGYHVSTYTGFDFPEDKIWSKGYIMHQPLISTNELLELFEKRNLVDLE